MEKGSVKMWVEVIVILAILGAGVVGYKMWHKKQVAMLQKPFPATSGNSLPSKGTSNQDLNQDMQSIQGSMNQLQQDQAVSNQDSSNTTQDTPQQ